MESSGRHPSGFAEPRGFYWGGIKLKRDLIISPQRRFLLVDFTLRGCRTRRPFSVSLTHQRYSRTSLPIRHSLSFIRTMKFTLALSVAAVVAGVTAAPALHARQAGCPARESTVLLIFVIRG